MVASLEDHVVASSIFEILVPDLWVEIYFYFSIREIVRTRQICKAFVELLNLRPIWINAIHNEILGTQLLLPRMHGSMKDMSTQELGLLAIKAAQLAQNLASPEPRPISFARVQDQAPATNTGVIAALPGVINRYITQIFLFNGKNGARWLLSVSAGFRVSCWEILSEPINALAAGFWDCPFPIVDVAINKLPHHEGTFAVTHTTRPSNTYSAVIISVQGLESGSIPTFTALSELPSPPGRLRLLRGEWAFFWRRRSAVCTAINWKTKLRAQFAAVTENNDGPPNMSEASKAIDVMEGKLVVVTTEHIYVWDYDAEARGSHDLNPQRLCASVLLSFNDHFLFKVEAASTVPYHRSWGLESPDRFISPFSLTGNGMSILLRRKNPASATAAANDDEVFHYLVLWEKSAAPTEIHLIRRARISTHFVADIAYGPSGRGILLSQRKDDNGVDYESLTCFDVRRRDGKTGCVVPPAVAPWRPLAQVAMPEYGQISRCTGIAFDDAEGRVVVANAEGVISIFDFV